MTQSSTFLFEAGGSHGAETLIQVFEILEEWEEGMREGPEDD